MFFYQHLEKPPVLLALKPGLWFFHEFFPGGKLPGFSLQFFRVAPFGEFGCFGFWSPTAVGRRTHGGLIRGSFRGFESGSFNRHLEKARVLLVLKADLWFFRGLFPCGNFLRLSPE